MGISPHTNTGVNRRDFLRATTTATGLITAHQAIGETTATSQQHAPGTDEASVTSTEISYGTAKSIIITGNYPVLEYFSTEDVTVRYDAYTFSAEAGDKIQMTVQSDSDNSLFIGLKPPNADDPRLYGESDNPDSIGFADITASQTGEYTVYVMARDRDTVIQGNFVLSAQPNPHPTTFGATHTATVNLTDPIPSIYAADGPNASEDAKQRPRGEVYTVDAEQGDTIKATFETLTTSDNPDSGEIVSYAFIKPINGSELTSRLEISRENEQQTISGEAPHDGTYGIYILLTHHQLTDIIGGVDVRVDIASLEDEPTNTPPTASFTKTPQGPYTIGESLTFDASGSVDPDGEIVAYEWQFERGESFQQLGETVDAEAIPPAGESEVTLRVTDDDGATDTTTRTVIVEKDEPDIGVGLSGGTANPGEVLTVLVEVANTSSQKIGTTTDYYVDVNWEDSDAFEPGIVINVGEKDTGFLDSTTWSDWVIPANDTAHIWIDYQLPDDIPSGEYDITATVGTVNGPDTIATTTDTTVIKDQPGVQVTDVDDNPVKDAEYYVYAQGDYPDEIEESTMRLVEYGTTDSAGNMYLSPSKITDNDNALLVSVKKGNWFANSIETEPSEIQKQTDYSSVVLTDQLLVKPTLAQIGTNGDPYGVVSVWRSLSIPDPNEDKFYIEVTDTNVFESDNVWEIDYDTALNGPSTGYFFFTAPDEATIHRTDTQTLATHPPHASTHAIGEINPPFEYFHPKNETTNTHQLPIYETTSGLRHMQLTGAQLPTQQMGWHELTSERSQEAQAIEDEITAHTDALLLNGPITSKLCDKGGGCFSPLTIVERLEGINELLDGQRTLATGGRGLNNNYRQTEFPGERTVEYTEWREDFPKVLSVSNTWEASIVAEFTVEDAPRTRDGTDNELTRYSIETEWLRQANNRGVFTQSFTTGPVDVTSNGRAEVTGGTANITAQVHNRTLEPLTIAEVAITGDALETDVTDNTFMFNPGDVFYGKEVPIADDASLPAKALVTVTDQHGYTTSTTVTIHDTDEPLASQLVESDAPPASETTYADAIKQLTIQTNTTTLDVRIQPDSGETYTAGGAINIVIPNYDASYDVTVTVDEDTYDVTNGTASIPVQESGKHSVSITTDREQKTFPVTVTDQPDQSNESQNQSDAATPTPTNNARPTPTDSPHEPTPSNTRQTDESDATVQPQNKDGNAGNGFGAISAITSIGGLAYLLRNRVEEDENADER